MILPIATIGSSDANICRYDPFESLRQASDANLATVAQELAQSIIKLPNNPNFEPFWKISAQNVLTAGLLYFYKKGLSFPKAILAKPISNLIYDIADGDVLLAKMFISQLYDIEDSKLIAGIGQQLSTEIISLVTDNNVCNSLSPASDAIKWEDLDSNNIILSIPHDKLEQWSSITTLMLTQLIRSLKRRPDRYSEEGKNLPPILLLLDEFPSLGKVDVIANAIATLRNKNVTMCIIVQSLAQLDNTYGKNIRQIILDNCAYKAILSVSDAECQQYFSDLIGTTKSVAKSYSENYDKYGVTTGYGQQISPSREPIIFPHQLAISEDIILLHPNGICRIDKSPYYKK